MRVEPCEFVEVELVLVAQEPQVVVVLHPAVDHVAPDDGLVFLGDRSLFRIHGEPGGWKIKDDGKCFNRRLWRDGVTEANIDLQGNLGASKFRDQTDAHAAIFCLLTYRFRIHGLGDK